MKRNFVYLIAAIATMCVSCSNGTKSSVKLTSEEEIEAYLEESLNKVKEKADEWSRDVTLAQKELYAKIDSLWDETEDEIIPALKRVVEENGEKALSVVAVKNLASFLEDSEMLEVISKLGKEQKENEDVQEILSGIQVRSKTAPGNLFTDFEVNGVKFSDYVGKGKYVLVDFWASWCGPCKREIPNIADVYKKYKGDDFDVLSVAVWDKPEASVAAAKEHGVVWNQIIDAQRIPTDIYGIEGIPQIMLFGPDGTILKRDLRGAEIEAAVREALGR